MDQFHERQVVNDLHRIADAIAGRDDSDGLLPTPLDRIAEALEAIANAKGDPDPKPFLRTGRDA